MVNRDEIVARRIIQLYRPQLVEFSGGIYMYVYIYRCSISVTLEVSMDTACMCVPQPTDIQLSHDQFVQLCELECTHPQ